MTRVPGAEYAIVVSRFYCAVVFLSLTRNCYCKRIKIVIYTSLRYLRTVYRFLFTYLTSSYDVLINTSCTPLLSPLVLLLIRSLSGTISCFCVDIVNYLCSLPPLFLLIPLLSSKTAVIRFFSNKSQTVLRPQ